MKYRNIELISSQDRNDELLCGVEFENPDENDELSEEIKKSLYKLLAALNKQYKIYIEQVLDNYFCVRSNYITLNKNGIDLLKKIYNTLSNSGLNIKVTVNVYINSTEWFKGENGKEYNEDQISWEEFMRHLEY